MLRIPVYLTLLAVGLPVFVSRVNADPRHGGHETILTTVVFHPVNDAKQVSDNGYSGGHTSAASVDYIDYFEKPPPHEETFYDYEDKRPHATEYADYEDTKRPLTREAIGNYDDENNMSTHTVYEYDQIVPQSAFHRQIRHSGDTKPHILPPTDDKNGAIPETVSDLLLKDEIVRRNTLDGIHDELVNSGLIPDVLPSEFQPEFNITLRFNNQTVQLGEVLTLNDTRHEPIIEFDSQPEQTFSVAIVDPDAPSMARHGYRSFRHFLVSNLDSQESTVSNILTAYEPPKPAFGTGMHRYAVVVLKQLNGRFNVTDSDVPESRTRFNVIDWGKTHNMKPVAASFFLVKRMHQNEHVDYSV
ncbi:hypothetical protein GGI15_000561 [Coemansia interrupta]|uniref:PEBP-like protein n=1 Tax=Coemansia interrupta TaxID=1126814 RepID=A0A9W8HPI1_9FUNG|nr:hypothetical protein GGI15_000561 [Coemansia interrupta]